MKYQQLFNAGFEAFLHHDLSLVESEVSERCLCSRLAFQLEQVANNSGLDGYFADVEYNRNKGAKKTLVNDDYKEITICCDLLLHSRGVKEQDNLIAIEMKKSGRKQQETVDDCERLTVLTRPTYENGQYNEKHVCGYKLGVFIFVDYQKREFQFTYFENGCVLKNSVMQF
ncbi:hypothetical protein [Vibrio lentus]|uniref:hypothetical protein n=1 Tax=Vibrio lentus TaxID=136468 RepID=UPI00178C87F7|nr:hypothetical protein [Vibrio lentus]MDN3628203.1 hypothetical protein [Vibrio lentus]